MNSLVEGQASKRLKLREMQPSDWTFVHDIRGPDVTEEELAKRTESESKQFVGKIIESRNQKPRTFYRFVVVLLESNRSIGWCDLYLDGESADRVEIGFRIDARYCGQGFATEAGLLAIAFAFQRLDASIVWAECEPDNYASICVLNKLGMRQMEDSKNVTELDDALYFETGRETWLSTTISSTP